MKDVAMKMLALICLICMAAASLADDWPQFRGPDGQGSSSELGLPSKWSDTENLSWKIELPGYGASSPISLDGRLYTTCYSGYGVDRENMGDLNDLMLHLVCVDAIDGTLLWNTKVKPTLPEEKRIRDHGYAAATPATDGNHLYVFFGKSGVLKFDLAGKQIWRTSAGEGTHGWGCGTSPVLFEDLVIVNASVESGALIAIKKESGEIAWKAPGMKSSWNTPHLVKLDNGKFELVVSVRDKILGFDPASGDELWSCDGVQDYVCPSIISRDGIVYAIGGRTSRAFAIRAGGRGDVTDTHLVWQAKAGANVSSPVLSGDHLYWVSDRNKTAYCLRAADGEIVHKKRFPGQPYASTMVADGKLFVVTRYDGTFVLAAKPKFEQLAHNEFDDESTFNASPIVANGKLYIRSDRFLYCIGES